MRFVEVLGISGTRGGMHLRCGQSLSHLCAAEFLSAGLLWHREFHCAVGLRCTQAVMWSPLSAGNPTSPKLKSESAGKGEAFLFNGVGRSKGKAREDSLASCRLHARRPDCCEGGSRGGCVPAFTTFTTPLYCNTVPSIFLAHNPT